MTGALLVLLFLALVAALVLTSVSTRRRGERRRAASRHSSLAAPTNPVHSRYARRPSLLSAQERAYFGVLEPVARELGLHVTCKTRLAELVSVPHNAGNRIALTNRMSNQVLDFVLCEPASMAPCLVIDLSAPQATSRGDRIKEEALVAAELPLLRVEARRSYLASEVRRNVVDALGGEGELAKAA